MTDVFMKYDGQSAESTTADYLQTQVCCSSCSFILIRASAMIISTPLFHFPFSLQSSSILIFLFRYFLKNKPSYERKIYIVL